jgi:adenylate kinase
MNIIILGQQGSGKGTQAGMLAQKFNLEHIDAGSTLREVAKLDTDLGREIYQIQNVSKTLVPSRILEKVLHIKIKSLPREQGIVFDGVPRTEDQLAYIENAMLEFGRQIDSVIFVSIPEKESIARISKRLLCERCGNAFVLGKDKYVDGDVCPKCGGKIKQRIDDTEAGIRKRLGIFNEETRPVIEYFRKKGILIEIDGKQAVADVFADILKKLKQGVISD